MVRITLTHTHIYKELLLSALIKMALLFYLHCLKLESFNDSLMLDSHEPPR